MTAILIEDDVTYLRREFNKFIDDYGWNVICRHFTGQKPKEQFNNKYGSIDSDFPSIDNNWNYTDTTIKVCLQYAKLPNREERETVTTVGTVVNQTATIFCKNDATIEQGDEIIDGTQKYMVEMVIPYKLSKGDATAYVVYYECKIKKTADVRS